eukprot:gene1800-33221_t
MPSSPASCFDKLHLAYSVSGSMGSDAPAEFRRRSADEVPNRKPYMLTKQRETWSPEEHAEFLKALQLYNRDWKKIEAHIGTKTMVQKTTKAGNGESVPPPRPKRKNSDATRPTMSGGTSTDSKVRDAQTEKPEEAALGQDADEEKPLLVEGPDLRVVYSYLADLFDIELKGHDHAAQLMSMQASERCLVVELMEGISKHLATHMKRSSGFIPTGSGQAEVSAKTTPSSAFQCSTLTHGGGPSRAVGALDNAHIPGQVALVRLNTTSTSFAQSFNNPMSFQATPEYTSKTSALGLKTKIAKLDLLDERGGRDLGEMEGQDRDSNHLSLEAERLPSQPTDPAGPQCIGICCFSSESSDSESSSGQGRHVCSKG